MMSKDKNRTNDVLIEAGLLSLVLTGTTLATYRGYTRYLRQIRNARGIPSKVFRKRWLYGKVTAVGDGDNFHFFHMPGGLFGGWGWLRSTPQLEKIDIVKKSRNSKRLLDFFRSSNKYVDLPVQYKNKRRLPTISVRICGVDAPERSHFGNPAQPYSEEALIWLQHEILGKKLWIKPLNIDQYGRCVASIRYWTRFGYKDLSLQMLKEGLALVYEGKSNAEFGGREKIYRRHEFIAKSKRIGMWSQKKLETPGDYKRKL
uniref:Probable endonuclease LCL3 n=1 Tax=Nakaseomyces delphensis TaxID=51657 RepID=LCL3_NAKDE|nr:RecName: Full=Probable endonuclease LCL3 [Nakaseomyces delphensis]AAO25614.1 YGL085w [Nakaseomyces delphensis]